MTWVILLLVATGLALLIRWKVGQEAAAKPLAPEEAVQVAIELHAIRRRLDVAWTKAGQRQDASRLRREIGEALNGDGEDGRR
jgi:hypothetical protein